MTATPVIDRSRRLLAVFLVALLAATALTLTRPSPASAAPSAPAPAEGDTSARAAARWLAQELVANDHRLPSPFGTGTDWGLTIDALFALASAQVAGDVAQQTADQIAARGHEYTQGGSIGAIAKTALALQVAGLDPTSFHTPDGPVDLIDQIRGSITDSGRFEGANHFGQSLAVLALARTADGVPDTAVDHLLSLQCVTTGDPREGGFGYESGAGACDTVDADGTGIELSALLAAGYDSTDAEVQKAVGWMQRTQNPDGSFAASWDPETGNGNSTGLVGQVARQIGTGAADSIADKAHDFVAGLQVTCAGPFARGDDPATGGGFVHNWYGALAYNQDGYDAAVAGGIEPEDVDQWLRNSAQALLTLDAAPGFSELTLADAEPGIPALPSCVPVPTVPDAPAKPSVAVAGQAVTVSWTEPADGGSPVTGYDITLTPVSGAPLTETAGSSATSATFSNVPAGSWTATVTASNQLGSSPASPASEPFAVSGATATTTTATAGRLVYGKKGTVSVAVSGGATGTVSTTIGSRTISGTLSGGRTSLTIPARSLKPGTRTLTITYRGVPGRFAASSRTVRVAVAKATPRVKVTASKATRKKVRRGTPAVYTVVVTAPGTTGVRPTGRVTVRIAGTSKTVRLSSRGKAKVTITIPKKTRAGRKTVTVRYRGSTDVAAGKAKTIKTKVTT